jgi:hypothetical protein
MLMRMCTEDYTVPGTCIHVKKDDLVSISVAGIHSDAGTPRLANKLMHSAEMGTFIKFKLGIDIVYFFVAH